MKYAVAEASWIHQHKVSNATAVTALLDDLDRGEAEAIVLALELGADLLLPDEADGRHHAQRMGLYVTAVMGILRAAKAKQIINSIRPHLDALRSVAGFYFAEDLYQFVEYVQRLQRHYSMFKEAIAARAAARPNRKRAGREPGKKRRR